MFINQKKKNNKCFVWNNRRERKDSAESVLEQTGRKGFGRIDLNIASYWEMQARKIAVRNLAKSQALIENPCYHDIFL